MVERKKLGWCFALSDGLRVTEPNERLARSYLKEAKASLERAEKDLEDGDLLWATVVLYYAEYYAAYSFLQRIGVKCGNHFCSLLAAGFLLGEEKTERINRHKDKRIDAQYYMKVDKEEEVRMMVREAKIVVSAFDEIVSTITEKEIGVHRERLRGIIE